MQVFITSEEAEQGVNPMDINKGMRSYRFIFVFFSFFRIPKIYKGVNLGFFLPHGRLPNKLKEDCEQSVMKCNVLCFVEKKIKFDQKIR